MSASLTLIALALIGALLAASCSPMPSAPVPPAEKPAPQSKPLKMPPTNRKLGDVQSISMDEFFPLQQSGDVLIYDVRAPYFFGTDHIPGAINWPHTAYDAQVRDRDIEIQKALNKGQKVVLYCFHLGCPEARNVAKKLARRDYVVHVFGMGIDSWREAGLPLETKAR